MDTNSLLLNRFKIQCNKFSGTISRELGVIKKSHEKRITITVYKGEYDRARGRNGGRKEGSYNKEKAKFAATLYKSGNHYIKEILKATGIKSSSTIHRYLRKEGVYK